MQFDMGFGAFAIVIVAALVLGVLAQMYLSPKTPYEWLITGAGVGIGAWLASEIVWSNVFSGLKDLGPQVDGLAIIPAVLGGFLLGAIFEAVARMVEGPAPATA